MRLEAADWFGRMKGPDAERLRLEFERWRAADPTRREAYARLEAQYALAGNLRNSAIGRSWQMPRKRSWSSAWGVPRLALAGGALCVAAIAGGVALLSWQPDSQVVASSVTSGIGQIRTLRLSDGSSVTLDTDSAITVGFDGTKRLVNLLRGRARFDVATDAGRPFVVDADGRSVVATGTVFDVALWRGDMRVSLFRGSADVRSGKASSSSPGGIAHLLAGQSCALGAGQPKPIVERTPAGAELWVGGMLSFNGTPLSDVLTQTNRYSVEQIRLADASLAPLRVTGVFRPTPTGQLAGSLAAAFGLRVEHPSGRNYILRKR